MRFVDIFLKNFRVDLRPFLGNFLIASRSIRILIVYDAQCVSERRMSLGKLMPTHTLNLQILMSKIKALVTISLS